MLSTKLAIATLLACAQAHPGFASLHGHSKRHIAPRQVATSNGSSAAATTANGTGTMHMVDVGKGGLLYTPNNIVAQVGDMIMFTFHQKNHTVTQSSFASPCTGLGTTSGSQVLNASQVTAGTAPGSQAASSNDSSQTASENNSSSSSNSNASAASTSNSNPNVVSTSNSNNSGVVSTSNSSKGLEGGLVKAPGGSSSDKSDKGRSGDSNNDSDSRGRSERESFKCDCKCSGSSWNFDFEFDCNLDNSNRNKYKSYNSKGSDRSKDRKNDGYDYSSGKSSSYKAKRDAIPRGNQDCRCQCSSNGDNFSFEPEGSNDRSGKSKDNRYYGNDGRSSSDKCDFRSSDSRNSRDSYNSYDSYDSYDNRKGRGSDSRKSGGNNNYYSKRQSYSYPSASSSSTSSTASTSTNATPVPGMTGADSGFVPVAADVVDGFPTWTIMVTDTKPIWFFCAQATHCSSGMVGAINAPATGNTFDKYMAAAKAAVSTGAWPSAPRLNGVGINALAAVDSSKLVTNGSSTATGGADNGTSGTNNATSSKTSGTTSGAKMISIVPGAGAVLVSFIAVVLSL